ncbi:hypothetical protein CCACVL1_12767 [Corchorus capsularis]|uniref:Uncharacterized protein n=1 Tax=Corchorus capsularis TaxID=210143 RepID=A0A1R3IDX7_COCAP|nr:hypothetical protein CCACVL1_12767 [Corchorus capsularis]
MSRYAIYRRCRSRVPVSLQITGRMFYPNKTRRVWHWDSGGLLAGS